MAASKVTEKKRIPQKGIATNIARLYSSSALVSAALWFSIAEERIETRYLNRWVKDKVCEEGMDYLKELADVLLPGGAGKTQIRIIAEDHRNIKACFTEFFNRWGERVVDATWKKLIDALVETDKVTLAKEIGDALTPQYTVPL